MNDWNLESGVSSERTSKTTLGLFGRNLQVEKPRSVWSRGPIRVEAIYQTNHSKKNGIHLNMQKSEDNIHESKIQVKTKKNGHTLSKESSAVITRFVPRRISSSSSYGSVLSRRGKKYHL